jgi:tetratricopeptide (TPR) repeat protein
MWTTIFLAVIAVALIVISVVIFRKFPMVANLDLEHLAEEQEAKKKYEMIEKRLIEKGREAGMQLQNRLSPLKKIWSLVQFKFRIYVGKIEKLLHYEELLKHREQAKQMTYTEKENKLNELLLQAGNQFNEANYDKAEEFYIAAIRIDKKSSAAYRGLGDTYMARGAKDEAMQTYDFLTRLAPDDDALLVKLSDLCEESGKTNEAINYLERAIAANDSLSPRYYRLAELYAKAGHPDLGLEAVSQAVELEPKNPKYLDLLIETAIICGNRNVADVAFEELRLVNPENQKLAELKEKIEKIV